MYCYIQTLQVKEDPTSYPISSCNKHKGIILVSG